MKRRQFVRAVGAREPEIEIIDAEMVEDERYDERLQPHRAPAVQPSQPDDQVRDLIDQLVARFDHSLREQERELAQLRRTVLDLETAGSADREELMLTQRICQVLERENKALGAEVEETRGAAGQLDALHAQLAERDAQLVARDAALAERAAQVEALQAQLQAAEQELRQLRRKQAPLDSAGMLERLLLQAA